MNSEQILLEVKNIDVRRGGVRVLEVPQFSLRQGRGCVPCGAQWLGQINAAADAVLPA